MNEMIKRCVANLAEMPIPCNRFNLRDALIATMIVIDGPIAVPLSQKGADQWLIEIVRTVLAAMCEPTEAMIEDLTARNAHDTGTVWRAMIDAALADHPGAPGEAP